jgi:hypothetical protein
VEGASDQVSIPQISLAAEFCWQSKLANCLAFMYVDLFWLRLEKHDGRPLLLLVLKQY